MASSADLEDHEDGADNEGFGVEEGPQNIGLNEEVGSTPRRQCPECLVRCHIRCNKCPSCHAVFPPSKKKLALGPPRRYPSNLFAQLHKKANQLHQVGYDVFILTHKSNPTLHSFQRIATPGAAVDFNIKYDKVYQLWRTYMSVKQSEDLTPQSALLPSQPSRSEDLGPQSALLPSQPTERGSEDLGPQSALLPSQPTERGSEGLGPQSALLPSQPSRSEDMGPVLPSQPSGSGPQSALFPSQPTEHGSEGLEPQSALLPSQPTEHGSEGLRPQSALLPSQPSRSVLEDLGSQSVLLPSQPTERCGENQDVAPTGKQNEGQKSRKRRRCGDCVNCQKPKCQKCLPCQNPKWKKPCKERKCLQLLNI